MPIHSTFERRIVQSRSQEKNIICIQSIILIYLLLLQLQSEKYETVSLHVSIFIFVVSLQSFCYFLIPTVRFKFL